MTSASEITVIASGGFKAAYTELVPAFSMASKYQVLTTWAGSVDIMKRLQAGDVFDVIIMPKESIGKLVDLGKVAPGSRVDVAKSGIGVAVRRGAAKPEIRSSAALKAALLAARSVAYSTSASGIYLAALFERMGIADELKPKIRQSPPGVPVGELIARGEAELGFQQISELLPLAGIEYLGPLPDDIQHFTTFSAGVHAATKHADGAKALIAFLAAPGTAPIIRKFGMEPA